MTIGFAGVPNFARLGGVALGVAGAGAGAGRFFGVLIGCCRGVTTLGAAGVFGVADGCACRAVAAGRRIAVNVV